MNFFKIKYALAKLIDLATSFSIIRFFYTYVDQQLPFSIECLILGGLTLIPLTINYLLFKFSQLPSLGESILGIKKKESFKWFRLDPSMIEPSGLSYFHRGFYTILGLFFMIAPLSVETFIYPYSNDVTGLNTSKLKWKPFKHESGEWKIEFPTTPCAQETTLNLPDDSELKLSEITAQHKTISYSIASATLPEDLLKWSPNLILKGSLKILANNLENGKSTTDKIFKYRNFPTLPYTFQQGETFIHGRLLLIEDTLYKIEVECPHHEKDQHQEKLDKFFNSFIPN
jgi:hypothetical protein